MSPRVSAIIPAYNEAERLGATLAALRAIDCLHEVIVVDDGSTDRTAEIARLHGATKVIRLSRNRGKGAALNEGLAHATGEILLFLDADLQESAAEADRLLRPLLDGVADMTIALLPPPAKKGGLGFVVRAAREGIARATGRRFAQPLSGQRALTRALIARIGRLEERFGVETALTIDALRAGARVIEVPTNFRHRETGRDVGSLLHRLRQWWDVKRALRKRL